MMGVAHVLAAITELLGAYFDSKLYFRPDVNGHDFGVFWLVVNTIHTGSNYTEVVALVPAVRLVFQTDASIAPKDETADSRKQRQAALFFTFMAGFYLYEDVVQAFMMVSQELPSAAVAHIVHFALLVDFVGYFLLHMYNLGAKGGDLVRAALCMDLGAMV
jgi:hypothetical protein